MLHTVLLPIKRISSEHVSSSTNKAQKIYLQRKYQIALVHAEIAEKFYF